MCVVLEESESLDLPTRRVDLYSEAIDSLLSTRHGTKAYPKIDRFTLLSCLRSLAFELFVAKREVFEKSEIVPIIKNQGAAGGVSPTAATIDNVVSVLVEQAGLLTAFGTRGLRFLHLTFQEYLAADHIVRQTDPLCILEAHLNDPRWEEVVRLVGALLEPDLAYQLLISVWDGNVDAPPDVVSFAGRCASDISECPSDYVRTLVNRLTTLMYNSDVSAYSDACLVALSALCSRKPEAMEQVIHLFRSMAKNRLSSWQLMKFIQLLELVGSHEAFVELKALFAHFQQALSSRSDEGTVQLLGALGAAIRQTESMEAWEFQTGLLNSSFSYLQGVAAQSIDSTQLEQAKSWLVDQFSKSGGSNPLINYLLSRFDDQSLTAQLLEQGFCTIPNRMVQAALRSGIWSQSTFANPEFVRTTFRSCSGSAQGYLLDILTLFLRMSDLRWVEDIVKDNQVPLVARAAAMNLLTTLQPSQILPLIAFAFSEAAPLDLRRIIIGSLGQSGSSEGLKEVLRFLKPDCDDRLISSMLTAIHDARVGVKG